MRLLNFIFWIFNIIMEQIKIWWTYKHYKWILVKVIWVWKHSETLEDMIFYDHLDDNEVSKYWVRPLDMFLWTVEINWKQVKRFELID